MILKKLFSQFKLYLTKFNYFSFSIFLIPISNIFSNFFVLKKKIKITDYNGKERSIIFRADNLITHFRSNLFYIKEREVQFFIEKKLKLNDVFFDVGANIGVFSIYAAIKKKANVYAFEPEYSNINLLRENIIKNDLINNIFPFSFAIGNECRITKLHIADFTPGSAVSSISKESLKKTDEGYNVIWKEGVMELTLDKIIDELKIIPKMLKIDTDGNEKIVLLGSKKLLSSSELKNIIVEKTKNKSDYSFCTNLLNEFGYIEIEKSDKGNSFWEKI